MAIKRISLDYDGIGAMLRGGEMASYMEQIGASKAADAGQGYAYRVHNTGQRQAVNVFPNDYQSYKDNIDNNTLLLVMSLQI